MKNGSTCIVQPLELLSRKVPTCHPIPVSLIESVHGGWIELRVDTLNPAQDSIRVPVLRNVTSNRTVGFLI